MHDRPTAAELLSAARLHLEREVLPGLSEPRLRYQTLVAANVLAIVERELIQGEGQLEAEWQRLDDLLGAEQALPTLGDARPAALDGRRRELCERIRAGQFDYGRARQALLHYLQATVLDKLLVANPKFLSRVRREAG